MQKLSYLFIVFLFLGCSSDDKKSEEEVKVSEQSIATKQIQSQQWCMERVSSHFGGETVRISFDASKKDESGKMKVKFDRLISHRSKWASYSFGDKHYNWEIASDESSVSLDTIYLRACGKFI